MNPNEVAEEFNYISEKLVDAGLVHLMGGNLSVRDGEKMAITGHYSSKTRITMRDLFIVDVDRDDEPAGASKTLHMHRAIFRKTNAKAIVHAHPYYATLISYYVDAFHPIDENGIYYLCDKIECIRAEGYQKWALLADPIADTLTRAPAMILKWHGSFTIGASMAEALHHTQALELSARLVLDTARLTDSLGPAEIPDYAKANHLGSHSPSAQR